MNPPSHCLECSAPLTSADAGGLCPKCLLKLGLASQFGEASVGDAGARKFIAPPQFPFDFGGYRVLRLLGRGGMGAVYEAEQHATGRRVALKVLGHTIDSPEMRKRFLREGRLAASVNHPNTVYIFGTEEIEGAPVIAMELVAGGTLRDRVKRGALPVREAVDATLQIIAGLEAAAGAGVLHRDVKPANCFVAPDGTVKVGDFGLSVSTLARSDTQITASGTMLGTPSFAPPEQLRGDELDVRADIYSTGATLYALLTGHAPFEGDNAVNVVAAVLDKAPRAIAEFRADVPSGLVQLVGKCLAKKSTERFANYAALRAALLPFSSEAREPAPPGLRTVAGMLDVLFAALPGLIYLVATGGGVIEYYWLSERTLATTAALLGSIAFAIAYYAIPEGLRGASLGKMMCGLRVVGASGAAPGLRLAVIRAVMVVLLMHVPTFVQFFISSAEDVKRMMEQDQPAFWDCAPPFFSFLLFVTIRRRNGLAAIHDLLTGTRVILRPKSGERPRLQSPAALAPTPDENAERLGPFRVLAPIAGSWFAGYDEALRRNVWLRKCAADAPPLAPARRDLGRAGRLRWIAGTRDENDGWDAFDAPTGKPLAEISVQPWAAVRCWLLDLAEELDAAKDGTLPPAIGLDHVWITAAGRALLLDEPWPCAAPSERFARGEITGAQRFLDAVANTSLDRTRLPLHARDFLKKLGDAAFDRASFIIGNLRSLLAKPAALSRLRRFLSLALVPGLGLLIIAPFSLFLLLRQWQEDAKWADRPELRKLAYAAEDYANVQSTMTTILPDIFPPRTRAALEWKAVQDANYISEHFSEFVASPQFDSDPAFGKWSRERRDQVREIVKTHPYVKPDPQSGIDKTAEVMIRSEIESARTVPYYLVPGMIVFVLWAMCVSQFFSLLIFGATLGQRLFGFGVVDQRGEIAGRGRMLVRWAVIWLPAALLCFTAKYGNPMAAGWIVFLCATSLCWLGCAIRAVVRPGHGLHDDLAGTRLVPR